MTTTLQSFLDSNLLYKYLISETDALESAEVEYFIVKYPQAKAAYDKLQHNLEIHAKANAVEAPQTLLHSVLNTTEDASPKTKVVQISTKKTVWYTIAASAAAILFAITSFLLYQNNQGLKHENNVVVDELFDLRSDIDKNNSKLNLLSEQILKLNNPDAKKYVLSGNERAKNLTTVAYINPVEKTSMLDVITLPQLPEEQYFQMWAELQGRMVNLGIIDQSNDDTLKRIPYLEDALALSITIETKGDIATTYDNAVAEISLVR